jgi:hypothetical protein
MSDRKAKENQPLQELAKQLFSYSQAKVINEELWQLLIIAMGTEEVENWPPKYRGNVVLTFKKVSDFLLKAEQTI